MHADIGKLVLYANLRFKFATIGTLLLAWVLGRHEVFTHLGRRCRISWWKGTPYLLSFKEVGQS